MTPKNKALFLEGNQRLLIDVPHYFVEVYKFFANNVPDNEIHEDMNNDSIYTISKDLFIKGMTKIFCKKTNKKFLLTHLEIIDNVSPDSDYTFRVIEYRNHI